MVNKTKIEWVKNPDGSQGYTWNPITGCNNQIDGMCQGGGFPCYAYRLANTRLRDKYLANKNTATKNYDEDSYPFYPRFWPERLNEIPKLRGNKGIFVCDMSDLSGLGIPDEWTHLTLEAIRRHPEHRFYLLTKQGQNLAKWSPFPDNCRVGVTATDYATFVEACGILETLQHKDGTMTYISLEPLLSWDSTPGFTLPWLNGSADQVIIGAVTGTKAELSKLKDERPDLTLMPYGNKWTLQPKIEWTREIIEAADTIGAAVFLKNNLKPILKYPSSLRQELPNK